MKKLKLSLILPVYNEAEIIEHVLKDIFKALDDLKIEYEILLVEDGQNDKSYKKLSEIDKKYKNVRALRSGYGYGTAILCGLENSRGENVSYMPSDGQSDMNVYPKLWNEFIKNQNQIVKIKRNDRESFFRLFASKFLSYSLKLFFNTPILDTNGSPRIIKKSNMIKLNLKSHDSFIDSEILIKAKQLKWTIKEIQMENLERKGGKSSRSYKTYLEFIKNILKYRLKTL